MLLITGTVRLPDDRINDALPAMHAMVAASRAEDGCIEYSYAQDIVDRGLIRVTEMWRDRAALDAHFASDHLAHWRGQWAALGIHDRQLQMFEAGKPISV